MKENIRDCQFSTNLRSYTAAEWSVVFRLLLLLINNTKVKFDDPIHQPNAILSHTVYMVQNEYASRECQRECVTVDVDGFSDNRNAQKPYKDQSIKPQPKWIWQMANCSWRFGCGNYFVLSIIITNTTTLYGLRTTQKKKTSLDQKEKWTWHIEWHRAHTEYETYSDERTNATKLWSIQLSSLAARHKWNAHTIAKSLLHEYTQVIACTYVMWRPPVRTKLFACANSKNKRNKNMIRRREDVNTRLSVAIAVRRCIMNFIDTSLFAPRRNVTFIAGRENS